MTKKTKKFREYYEEDEWTKDQRDEKRYDRKKAHVQEARKQKKSLKESLFDT